MALTPGLSPSLRLPPEPAGPAFQSSDVVIEEAEPGADMPVVDDRGAILKIEHPDGSVTITMDGSPLRQPGPDRDRGWWDNLIDDIDDLEQSRIAEELMRGIEADDNSRQDWIEQREKGMQLLGLRPELPGLGGSADGAPVEGISRVRHPLLLEAVLRFQANARSELLPTDGPVKVRDDGNGTSIDQDRLADALENDLNHYLTAVASEYYPDTDRMLFSLGFGGTSFKKIYYCPLRNRPVSESVDANDLIVSQSATDLQNAKRVTHRVVLRNSTVKRLQILGVYKDTELGTPNTPTTNAFEREKKAQEGISVNISNPEDRDREIYECYCELDVKGFEHKIRGKETGLEIPYRVTIDKSSRKILSITRNYDEDTQELPEARKVFVKYVFVPGFEFYGIGLLHILGNTTNAVTAAWREMLDAGMYSNFPGFLFADVGARQNTSIFRVPPGGGSPIKTGGMPINQAVMPLPYKEPSAALMTLVDNMATTGMRIGGTSEQQVGEGRADAPVGTTLAMIDQATKVMNSVHKRLHAAQAEEFQMLVEVFKEHPESFWQRNRRPAYQWDEQTFLRALEDCNLVPQADPNTASHTQRVMKVMALKQLQAAQPSLYDPIAIDRAALQAIGFNNPEQFFAPPPAQASPPPELMQVQAQIRQGDTMAQAAKTAADARMLDAQTKAAKEGISAQQPGGLHPHDMQLKMADLRIKRQGMVEQANAKDRDRMAQIEIEKMKLIGQAMRDAAEREHERQMSPGLGGVQGNA